MKEETQRAIFIRMTPKIRTWRVGLENTIGDALSFILFIHATTQKDAILPLFLVKLYLMFDHFFFKDCQYSWQVL